VQRPRHLARCATPSRLRPASCATLQHCGHWVHAGARAARHQRRGAWNAPGPRGAASCCVVKVSLFVFQRTPRWGAEALPLQAAWPARCTYASPARRARATTHMSCCCGSRGVCAETRGHADSALSPSAASLLRPPRALGNCGAIQGPPSVGPRASDTVCCRAPTLLLCEPAHERAAALCLARRMRHARCRHTRRLYRRSSIGHAAGCYRAVAGLASGWPA
jgi:hypothetical protein